MKQRDTYLWQIVELEIATVRELFAVLKPFLFVPDQIAVLIFVLGPADRGALRSRQTVDVRLEKRIASAKQNEIKINITNNDWQPFYSLYILHGNIQHITLRYML